jgi:hypothetical protein
MRCRNYVGQHRTAEGKTLPCEFDELYRVITAEKLYRNATRDQLVHVLRWAGWSEDRGFWAVPEGVKNA